MKKFIIGITALIIATLFLSGCSGGNVQTVTQTGEKSSFDDSNSASKSEKYSFYESVSVSESETEINNAEIPDLIPLELNTETEGELEEFDSVNVYKVTIPNSGLVEVTFISPHKSNGQIGGRYYISMSRAEEYGTHSLWFDEYLGSDYLATFCHSRLGTGDYYLKIYGNDVDVPEFGYKITVNYTDESNNPNVEHEWNDTFETAYPISCNTEITGNLNTLDANYVEYDKDYYKFTIDTESVIYLEARVSGYSINKYNVSMYDSDQRCIMNSSVTGDFSGNYQVSKCKTMRLEPGNYYVKFEWAGSSTLSVDNSIEYYFNVVTE